MITDVWMVIIISLGSGVLVVAAVILILIPITKRKVEGKYYAFTAIRLSWCIDSGQAMFSFPARVLPLYGTIGSFHTLAHQNGPWNCVLSADTWFRCYSVIVLQKKTRDEIVQPFAEVIVPVW